MANTMLENKHNELSILNQQHAALKAKDALQIINGSEDSAISSLPIRPKGIFLLLL
jgi:hypothetical protein